MNFTWRDLTRAEEVVDRCGDPQKFKDDYVSFRETNGVERSMILALEAQGLYQVYIAASVEV